MRIRAKTFEQWFKANFSLSEMRDIAQYGANAGWQHLIYDSDITKIYHKFKDELWEHLISEGESSGHKNPFEFMATFNTADSVCSATSLEVLVVYFVVENLAYRFSERI